ncbi:MAG: nucleoside kinase [Clostridia bacterium]
MKNRTENFEKTNFSIEEINKKILLNPQDLVNEDERAYHSQIDEIVEDIINNRKEVKLILLSGPSSAGKTTSSNLLNAKFLAHGIKTYVVSQDNFFVEAAKTPLLPDGSFDYENVTCVDMECFNHFLFELENEKVAHMPIFDFVKKRRNDEFVPLEIDKNSIIIMEGIHALNPILTQGFSGKTIAKIYIGLNSNYTYKDKILIPAKTVRLMRRCLRDFYTRGHSISATLDMWKNVCDGENLYIKPFKTTADYLLNSSHSYEAMLYAKFLKPLLENALSNPQTEELIKMLEQCEKLDSSLIPKNSLIQEFLAGN